MTAPAPASVTADRAARRPGPAGSRADDPGARHRLAALALLGLRLVRAGGTARLLAVVLGSALVTLLVTTALATPDAVRAPQAVVTASQRWQEMPLALLFVLPVVVLQLTLLRLSSATRDRRLAALRLVGLAAAGARVVALVETCATVLAGAGLGVVAYVALAHGTDVAGWGSAWLRRPLATDLAAVVLPALGLVLASAVVTLVATLRTMRSPLRARRLDVPAAPAWWRVVPLAAGVGVLAWLALTDHTHRLNADGFLPAWWFGTMLAAWCVAGVGVPLAVPVLSRGLVRALARQRWWHTGRLAARRLEVEPAAAARPLAGVATAAYVATIVLLFLAVVTDGSPTFLRERSYLREGPQPVAVRPVDPTSADPAPGLTAADVAAVDGVLHVTSRYDVDVTYTLDGGARCGGEHLPCTSTTVGTCEDLAQLQVVTGCRGDVVQVLVGDAQGASLAFDAPPPREVTLTGPGGSLVLPVAADLVLGDEARTDELFHSTPQPAVFVPLALPGVAEVVGEPTGFDVTAVGGLEVRERMTTALAPRGMTALGQPLDTYERTMVARAGLFALLGGIVLVGLVTAAVGAVDRTVERRGDVTALAVVGAPARVLRGAQVVQVLVPLVVAVTSALGAGVLASRALLAYHAAEGRGFGPGFSGASPVADLGPALTVGCVLVVLATLLGVGARIRPEHLRRE